MSETTLVYQTIRLLNDYGIPAWRQNTGARHRERPDGTTQVIPFGVAGASDVLGLIPPYGRFLAVELKMPGKRPTEIQWEYLLTVQRNGGVALWLDDPAQLHALAPALLTGAVIVTEADYRQSLSTTQRTPDERRPPPRRTGVRRGHVR